MRPWAGDAVVAMSVHPLQAVIRHCSHTSLPNNQKRKQYLVDPVPYLMYGIVLVVLKCLLDASVLEWNE
jgi:hypothetical protein